MGLDSFMGCAWASATPLASALRARVVTAMRRVIMVGAPWVDGNRGGSARSELVRGAAGAGYSGAPQSPRKIFRSRCNRRALPSESPWARMATSEVEAELHGLFVRGQAGDAAAYHAFLRRLGAHLRAYLARRLFGWPDAVE